MKNLVVGASLDKRSNSQSDACSASSLVAQRPTASLPPFLASRSTDSKIGAGSKAKRAYDQGETGATLLRIVLQDRWASRSTVVAPFLAFEAA